jgi:putative PIN family toxin of toxin-antitoxin system
MSIILDTNVIISSLLLSNSVPAKILAHAERHNTILFSDAILSEISLVLSRAKFRPYLDENVIAEFLARIDQNWKRVEIIHLIKACRDPKDDKFLELAINGEASHIVTGDKDLLVLAPFRGIKILTPAQYLEQIGKL